MSFYNFKSSYSLVNDGSKCSGDFKAKDSDGLNLSSEATGEDIKEVLEKLTSKLRNDLKNYEDDKKKLDKISESFENLNNVAKAAKSDKVEDTVKVRGSVKPDKSTKCEESTKCDKSTKYDNSTHYERPTKYRKRDKCECRCSEHNYKKNEGLNDYVVELESELESTKIDNKILEQRVSDLQEQIKELQKSVSNNDKYREAFESMKSYFDDLS